MIGVVGGVGSGKSALARLAADRWGLARIDGDAAGHAALRDPDVMRAVRETFGEAAFRPDGRGGEEVDRCALAARVFGDGDAEGRAKAALQEIVHPVIRADLLGQIAEARAAGAPAILLDAAVLLETGWRDDCDAVVFVDVPRGERLRRVAARGWDAAELDRREASQWSLARKRAAADAIIDNAGPLERAVERLDDLLEAWGVQLPADAPARETEFAGAA